MQSNVISIRLSFYLLGYGSLALKSPGQVQNENGMCRGIAGTLLMNDLSRLHISLLSGRDLLSPNHLFFIILEII